MANSVKFNVGFNVDKSALDELKTSLREVQNMANTEFYEDFSALIEDNNRKGVLPKIDGIQSIECLNNGTINEDNTDNAKYVIQMRITYYRD